jgi:protein TonB
LATEAPPPPSQQTQQAQQVEVLNIVSNLVQINTNFDFSQDFDPNVSIEEYQPIEIVTTEVDATPPVRVAEELPEFPGGIQEFYKLLRGELKYPESARNANIQGTVLIEFVVEKDGSISSPKVAYPLFVDCDKEAIRAIQSLPKWKPARNAGKPVRCYFTIPITFTLQ